MYQFNGWSETFQNHIENKSQNNSNVEKILFTFFKNVFGRKKIRFLCHNFLNIQSDHHWDVDSPHWHPHP